MRAHKETIEYLYSNDACDDIPIMVDYEYIPAYPQTWDCPESDPEVCITQTTLYGLVVELDDTLTDRVINHIIELEENKQDDIDDQIEEDRHEAYLERERDWLE